MTTIYTIGHSTHDSDFFLALLRQHGVTELVDIRHYPTSRHCPQFTQAALVKTLATAGITYTHLLALGGRRHTVVADSGNEGWRVAAFRSYADYALSDSFAAGLAQLEAIGRRGVTAYMCAERSHYQCHRRIVSDWLLALGWDVRHILATGASERHVYTTHAHITIVGGAPRVRYPAVSGSQIAS